MLQQWCQNAYLDGVKELYGSRTRQRHFIFWACTLTAMVGFTLYFVAIVVREYISTPTVTTVSTLPSTQLDMPEIMLCFNGGLNASALLAENFSNDLIYVLSGAMPSGTIQFRNLTQTQYELKSYLNINNITIDRLYEKFSYDCTDMAEYFYDAGADRLFNNKACSTLMTSSIISPIYGRCLVYRNNSVQHWPGLNGGVRVYLKFPPNSVAERFSSQSLMFDKSLSYVISLEKTFDIQTERFLLIPANTKTEIVLNTKRYIRLPNGKTKCNRSYDNGAMFNLCFGRCYADAVFRSCACVPFKYFHPTAHRGKRICTPFDEYSCTTFLAHSVECESGCVPSCDEWVFETTLSYGPVFNNVQRLGDEISRSRASVWIGYHTLQYTEIREIMAFSIEAAIANVGAQVGLWLGCSLVTIVQGVYYVYMAFMQPKKNNVRQIDFVKKSHADETSMRRCTEQTLLKF